MQKPSTRLLLSSKDMANKFADYFEQKINKMRPDLDRKRLKLQGPFPDACFDQSKALFLQFTPVTKFSHYDT